MGNFDELSECTFILVVKMEIILINVDIQIQVNVSSVRMSCFEGTCIWVYQNEITSL